MVDKRKKLEKERERPKEEFVRESSAIYISDDELISLMEERVPRIIRDKPYLKDRFRELFSDVFVEKRDIDKVLEEMRMEREEDRKRWEEMREDTNRRFEEMREDTNKRFEAVDRRFEALTLEIKQLREDTNKRFEAVVLEMKQMRVDMDKRFEEMRMDMDKRFEEMRVDMDKRFGEMRVDMDKRFGEMRVDMDKRFEEMRVDMDKRFEEMRVDIDKRFEEMRVDMDKRFEEMRVDMDKRFEEMRVDMDKRFEEMRVDMDKRFGEMKVDMDKQFEENRLDHRNLADFLLKKIDEKIGRLGLRWGVGAENTFRNALKEVLREMGLTVEKWQKVDEEGKMFSYPRMVEIDIVIKDGKTYAIEIKSSLSENDVENFDRCVKFYEMVEVRKVDEKIILAVYAPEKSLECAKHFGIKVISEVEEIKEVI